MQMSTMPVKRILLDKRTSASGTYEFDVDCGAVYFGVVYDGEGNLVSIDQYFYCDTLSSDDMDDAIYSDDLLSVDSKDFLVKAYLLSTDIKGNEWLRFHAVVQEKIDSGYFNQKYIGE